MKYIITDKREVRTGGGYHIDLAQGCEGKVIAAGHCERENGKVRVYGESIGFKIQSKPEDAKIIGEALKGLLPLPKLRMGEMRPR